MAEVTGGDKFLKAIAKLVKNADKGKFVKVGFFAGATYPDGVSVAQVAAWNDWGTKNIPPRPFFRTFAAEFYKQAPQRMVKLLKANDSDTSLALDLLGTKGEDDLRKIIVKWSEPPNAPSTVKAKGKASVLQDTGLMLRSVKHESA